MGLSALAKKRAPCIGRTETSTLTCSCGGWWMRSSERRASCIAIVCVAYCGTAKLSSTCSTPRVSSSRGPLSVTGSSRASPSAQPPSTPLSPPPVSPPGAFSYCTRRSRSNGMHGSGVASAGPSGDVCAAAWPNTLMTATVAASAPLGAPPPLGR